MRVGGRDNHVSPAVGALVTTHDVWRTWKTKIPFQVYD